MQKIFLYIGRIRQAPEKTKQQVVFLWTIIFIVIIFFIWLFFVSYSLSNSRAEDRAIRAEAEKIAAEKMALTEEGKIVEEESFPGLIPLIKSFSLEAKDNVVNGFWIIGDKLHK